MKNFDVRLQEAIDLHRAGKYQAALKVYFKLSKERPGTFDIPHLIGTLYLQDGKFDEAVELLTHASKILPINAICMMRLGLAYLNLRRLQHAIVALKRAATLDTTDGVIWDNLATAYKLDGRMEEALKAHEQAVLLSPKNAGCWSNYGSTLSLCSRCVEALRVHDMALSLAPDDLTVRFVRAQALHQLHRLHESTLEWCRVIRGNPNHFEARSYRLVEQLHMPDTDELQHFREHQEYGRLVSVKPQRKLAFKPHDKYRLGFLSSDFREQSCAFFLEPLLKHLDRNAFELFLYSDYCREDATTYRFKVMGNWRLLNQVADPIAEKIILADELDGLVDITGHFGYNRLPLLATRLARSQFSYLGYPNTTGVPAIDYKIGDSLTDTYSLYTEKLLKMDPYTSWSYQPPQTLAGDDYSLAAPILDRPVTFGYFGNLTKIHNGVLRLWGEILTALPEAWLFIKSNGLEDKNMREDWLSRMDWLGVPTQRVSLEGLTLKVGDHLTRYLDVDIAFDSFPYNGTTTILEALWMGVPVVTMPGRVSRSRVGATLMKAVERQDQIAFSRGEYVQISLKLAGAVTSLRNGRTALRDSLRKSSLMDHAGFAKKFGELVLTHVQRDNA